MSRKELKLEIAKNLTNGQIRVLLEKDLSKAELKEIAEQRAISVSGVRKDDLKRRILRNLKRQEDYEILAN